MENSHGLSTQRFRQVLEALPCAYIYGEILVNGHGDAEDYCVLEVNHSFSVITSTTRDKVIGKRIAGLFSLASVKDDIAVFAGVALTGDPVEKEFLSPHFGIHFRVFCFAPQEGYFVAMLTDLSREKKLEGRLEFIRQFGNSTSDEFFVVDSMGRFVLANSVVAERLGTTQRSIPGHFLSELNPMAESEWWDTLWKSLLKRGSLQFESDHRGKNGDVYPVELSIDLMEFNGRNYAAFVAKNVSRRRILSKALRQDRKFAELAASMAGYLVWMIDSTQVFRPLLGGVSNLTAGPVNEVFFTLLHRDDREELLKAISLEPEGTRDLRMKTDRGFVYHRFKWSPVEDNCIVGICYPLSGAGLSGMGSHSNVMDAICMMTESMDDRLSKLENVLAQNNTASAVRMVRAITSDFSNITGKVSFPEKMRFDAYLSDNAGMLKQLCKQSISVSVDASVMAVGICDSSLLENSIVRLLLVLQNTGLITAVSIGSCTDASTAGVSVTVAGRDGIQAALERSFIPVKGQVPGLASVYAMVRYGGGQVSYETMDEKVEFVLSFPRAAVDDDAAFILIAMPDGVDAARSSAALRNAGYSVAIENSFSEILRRAGEEAAGILVLSASMPDFSLDEIRNSVPDMSLIQIGGEQNGTSTKYLPDGFRTRDLVACVNEIAATAGKLQAEGLQDENLWREPRRTPPL
jgi:PAS domain S-box-containing protein